MAFINLKFLLRIIVKLNIITAITSDLYIYLKFRDCLWQGLEKMDWWILLFALITSYEVSGEFICETDGCLTKEDMGPRFAKLFEYKKQPLYPCLKFSSNKRVSKYQLILNSAMFWSKQGKLIAIDSFYFIVVLFWRYKRNFQTVHLLWLWSKQGMKTYSIYFHINFVSF